MMEEYTGMCCIYKITNTINGKVYIGQTINARVRLNGHRSATTNKSKSNKCYDYHLYRSIRKYGEGNFTFEVVKECKREELNRWELYYIREYNTLERSRGYNRVGSIDTNLKGLNVVTENQLDLVRELKESKVLKKDLEIKYGLNRQSINDINRGERYYIDGENYPLRKLTETSIKKLLKVKEDEVFSYGFKETKHGLEVCPEYICNKCKVVNRNNECKECKQKEYLKKREEKGKGSSFLRKLDQDFRENKERKITDKGVDGNNKNGYRESLHDTLVDEPNFTVLGGKYGITDNGIRRWCDKLGIPRSTKYYMKKYEDKYGKKYVPKGNYNT